MIVYFANRNLEIQGLAGTGIREGYIIISDTKAEEVETGVASFECEIAFNKENRNALEEMAVAGNYLLRNNGEENEFYTIIESEVDTKNQTIYIYAEDAGLDLLNEIAGKYEASSATTIETYINRYIFDSGFEIGINEVPDVITKKLSWDEETTVTERLASIASKFGGYEISFSFEIRGMKIEHRYVNIYEKRGKDIAEQLRLDRDIDRIITKKSVANLATAFSCTGGTPEDTESDGEEVPPITLKGYKYDDGDFWVGDDGILRSREAVSKWNRFGGLNNYTDYAGHIVRSFSYDTLSQATLCTQAIAELKKAREMEVNFEIDITRLPDNIKIGDRVNIVDDAGELYLNSRILLLETSVVDQSCKATLGEHLIKKSGISDTVAGLAAKFASQAAETARAWAAAQAAKKDAEEAMKDAEAAVREAEEAKTEAENAKAEAGNATGKVNEATKAAEEAEAAAAEAQQKAAQAIADAANAAASVVVAQSKAETAMTKAEEAESTANTAKTDANNAKDVANAAKLDAEKAQEDIEGLGSRLDTVSQTMTADYARKTDLTETAANLQSQISQNAAQISSTVSRVETIDETANNAAGIANTAQAAAAAAQKKADDATADAEAAQSAAETAQEAANAADAKAAKAATDLETAKNNLAAVTSRVGATEEEIAAAERAVEAAQAAADKAKTDAATAQSTANTAKENAAKAQTAAENAKKAADDAQDAVDNLAVRVTSAETKITQNSNAIELRATKAEVATTLGGYYTKAETEAAITTKSNAITSEVASQYTTIDDFNELAIGGRNLVAGTSKDTEYTGDKGSAAYKDVWAAKTIDIPTGTDYIVSFDAKAEVAQEVTCFFYSPNTTTKAVSSTGQTSQSADGACRVTLTTNWKRYWVKWTQTAASAVKSVIVGRNSTANNIYIRAVKLEEGNKATDWTPAPEDVEGEVENLSTRITQTASDLTIQINAAKTSASNAGKTATNYLNFSSAGLIVGDMTASSLGRNILIDSDSVDIRRGTTVLASYSDSKIQLGMNSTSSIIELCGGSGSIKYTKNFDSPVELSYPALTLDSARVALDAQNDILMTAGTADNLDGFSVLLLQPGELSFSVHYALNEDDGVGFYSGSEGYVTSTEIYGLSDNINLVSRYGTTLDSVAGNITTKVQLYADGGMRLPNGGMITGLYNTKEYNMVQMNASGYSMFGYGGYEKSIGRTYLDGNVVYVRSKGDIHLNPTSKIYSTKQIVMSNNVALQSYKSDGSTAIAMAFLNGSNVAFFGGSGTRAAEAVRLQISNDYLYFQNYSASSSTTPSIFYPNSHNKCSLGTSSHAWYRVYASNATIATSDRRKKENIVPLGISTLGGSVSTYARGRSVEQVDVHSELFDRLQPVQYNFIEGNRRICYGLVAQDVIEAMAEIGIGEDELDLVHHDTGDDPETGEPTDTYGIAYENLIALLIHEVQKLKAEVNTLKTTA